MKRYGMIGVNGKKIPINAMIRNVFWNKWKRGFKVNYGEIKKCDIANGEGVRVALFVSGCRHHCKGCFNSMTWDFNYGKKFTEETEEEILEALKPSYIDGLSLLGGEPFEPENQEVLVKLLRKVKERYPEKNIWCYSGYLFDEELKKESRASIRMRCFLCWTYLWMEDLRKIRKILHCCSEDQKISV